MAHTVTLRAVKRLVKPFPVAGGVLLAAIIVLAADAARFGGTFRSVDDHFAGTCSELPLAGSSEDIEIDRSRGVAYLSVLDRASLARSGPVTGTLMLLDLNLAEPAPRAAMAYDPAGFRPRGLSLFRATASPARVFVISQQVDGTGVEIAEQDANGAFVPRETISDPAFVQPYAVAATGPRQFYLANGSGTQGDFRRAMQWIFRRGLATLVYYDGQKAHVVERGLEIATGLALSPDGSRLYVGEELGKRLRVYRRETASGALTLEETVPLESAPAHLDVDSDGVVWIAAQPKLLSFYRHARDATRPAPTVVLRFDPRGTRPAAGEPDTRISRLYSNSGSQLAGGTAAAHWRNEFLVGSLMQNKVLICKPNP
jgi:arylesterase/paraoxonase